VHEVHLEHGRDALLLRHLDRLSFAVFRLERRAAIVVRVAWSPPCIWCWCPNTSSGGSSG
jgi:hypothetical protein